VLLDLKPKRDEYISMLLVRKLTSPEIITCFIGFRAGTNYVIGKMADVETVEQWEALLPWNMK